MAKSIYGFAEAATGGDNITEIIRLYNRDVAQNAGEAGVVSNPDVYKTAREKYLEPYSDDTRIQLKMAESQNTENKLRDNQANAGLAASVLESDVNEMLSTYAKQYYKDPQSMIKVSQYVYNTAVMTLDDEITQRKETGQAYGDLQTLINKYSTKANRLTELNRDYMAGGKPRNPNAYGWFIRTNPNDGSVINVAIENVDSFDQQAGFRRTDMMYGNVPVWTNTYFDDEGKEVARIGSNKFDLGDKDDAGNQILKTTAKQWGRYLKSWLPGGETPKEAKAAVRNLNLGAIQFGDTANLPTGSVAKDVRGNYYYYGKDGVYKAANEDLLTKFLNVTGTPVNDIKSKAFDISLDEAKAFGSFTKPDGTSRIIDDKMLGGLTSPNSTSTPQKINMLPSIDQPVKGTFSAVPLPATPLAENFQSTPASAFTVPRKKPGIKATAESSGGNVSAADVIKKETDKSKGSFAQVFEPIISPFKNLFRG